MKKALLITAIITIISYSASAQAAVKIASPISNLLRNKKLLLIL